MGYSASSVKRRSLEFSECASEPKAHSFPAFSFLVVLYRLTRSIGLADESYGWIGTARSGTDQSTL